MEGQFGNKVGCVGGGRVRERWLGMKESLTISISPHLILHTLSQAVVREYVCHPTEEEQSFESPSSLICFVQG